MTEKKVEAMEYDAYGCHDIGIMFTVKYTCPYCNNIVEKSGLEGYGEVYSNAIYYALQSYCPNCKQSCIVLNPNPQK